MKNTLIVCISVALTLFSNKVNGQGLGDSRSFIISENGSNFTTGTTNEGLTSISYIHAGATHKLRSGYFFDANNICVAIMSLWPVSDANAIIKRFNEKYVKVSEGKVISYKDYENSAIFEVEIKQDFIIMTIKKDN